MFFHEHNIYPSYFYQFQEIQCTIIQSLLTSLADIVGKLCEDHLIVSNLRSASISYRKIRCYDKALLIKYVFAISRVFEKYLKREREREFKVF